MSDSDSDETLANLPPAAECEIRCQRFADVTGTDTALAMMFLQNSQWNIDIALNRFYESEVGASSSNSVVVRSIDGNGADTAANAAKEDPKPKRFRVLSWNIDGLSTAYLKQRTMAVVKTIKSENAEVVFLQEVVPSSEAMLRENLADYLVLCAGTGSKEGYYCVILLHKLHTVLDHFQVHPFLSSMMARSLLTAVGTVKGVAVTLITSHLESTRQHTSERVKQLSTAFQHMRDAPSEHTVIFGGDLNIRDQEMDTVEVPPGIIDLWEATGKRKEALYTWDTFRNDNLGFEGRRRSKLRFDRLFLRHSTKCQVKPVYFELVGLQRLPDTLCFPSDHWGILAHLDIVS